MIPENRPRNPVAKIRGYLQKILKNTGKYRLQLEETTAEFEPLSIVSAKGHHERQAKDSCYRSRYR